jgi:DNA-binding response OmpR family regulator
MGGEKRLSKSILLLISDPLMLSVMEETLEREGYLVFPAGELGTAVNWLKDTKPDLLITRTYISGMPGHEAAKYLRNRCHQMRVLMVGGLLEDTRLQSRLVLEGFELFPKPFPAAQFIEKVKEMLGKVGGKTA